VVDVETVIHSEQIERDEGGRIVIVAVIGVKRGVLDHLKNGDLHILDHCLGARSIPGDTVSLQVGTGTRMTTHCVRIVAWKEAPGLAMSLTFVSCSVARKRTSSDATFLEADPERSVISALRMTWQRPLALWKYGR
jgi:hypothetical protein